MKYRVEPQDYEYGEPYGQVVAIDATDYNLAESETFFLHIRHVRSSRGKGFMPTVYWKREGFLAGMRGNGDVSLIKENEDEAYDQAIAEGKTLLEHFQKQFDEPER